MADQLAQHCEVDYPEGDCRGLLHHLGLLLAAIAFKLSLSRCALVTRTEHDRLKNVSSGWGFSPHGAYGRDSAQWNLPKQRRSAQTSRLRLRGPGAA
jgi:hypothetical protein